MELEPKNNGASTSKTSSLVDKNTPDTNHVRSFRSYHKPLQSIMSCVITWFHVHFEPKSIFHLNAKKSEPEDSRTQAQTASVPMVSPMSPPQWSMVKPSTSQISNQRLHFSALRDRANPLWKPKKRLARHPSPGRVLESAT